MQTKLGISAPFLIAASDHAVCACSDLEVLLLPLLHMLYTASGRAPSHLYMLLIILLILTQDASFAANVHKVQLSSVPWYRERLLNKTLLGKLFSMWCRICLD